MVTRMSNKMPSLVHTLFQISEDNFILFYRKIKDNF